MAAVDPSLEAGGPAVPGTELWVARYDEGNSLDEASSLAVSRDGTRVFVTGGSRLQFGDVDYATVAYDTAAGTALWTRRYNGPGSAEDQGIAVGVSPDGTKVFVTGRSFGGSPSEYDYATIAYEASTGATLWVSRYNGPFDRSYDSPYSLGVSSDGTKVFVTGAGFRGPRDSNNSDYATIAYDSSTGATLWVKRFGGIAGGQVWARSLGVSPDGTKVFVTGHVLEALERYDYGTIAYEASTGATLWVRSYSGIRRGSDFASSLSVSPDGSRVFVTGTSEGARSDLDYATISYNASTGATQWERRFTRIASGGDDAFSVGVSPDGTKVFVTGGSVVFGGPSDYDYATLAYDATSGALLWGKLYDGGWFDLAFALTVNPDGSAVYVTGASQTSKDSSAEDYATIAYDALSGAVAWVARYDGPGSGGDAAHDIGVDPDGASVFVTGQSVDSSTDYATVAYSTN